MNSSNRRNFLRSSRVIPTGAFEHASDNMKHAHSRLRPLPWFHKGLCLILLLFLSLPVRACTIFVLTDKDRTFFYNNEDWSNPKTRIWFIPAGDNYLGCVYVGFDNGVAQG